MGLTGHIITIVVAVIASTGFWTFINGLIERKHKKKTAEAEMLLGLGHDRIYELCRQYIADGNISHSEYDNLLHLYRPYQKMGGNGTAEKLMQEVEKLPMVED